MKKYLLVCITMIGSFVASVAQTPILNSSPSSVHKVLFLDFDGEIVIGTAWNTSANVPTITALPSTLSSAAKTDIWKRMAEDFRPFDVNVTTDVAKFNAANPTGRMRIVFTPSSTWYPASVGGVAFLNSFTWGGNPDTPCWVFENMLSYSAKNCAEAGSHEAGHTLSLKHQSVWNGLCAKTAEYHSGIGSGVTSWAPIMGVGYSRNVSIWHNGANSNTCTTIQFDHGSNGITGSLFLNYLTDDVGDNLATAKAINVNTVSLLDSGIISRPTEVDVYKFSICNNRYMTFNIKPWALDTVNYSGANLDVRFQLFNAATSNSLAIDTPLAKLNTLVGINLTAGSYYFVIDGGGSANYSDYGSLGKYYMRITSNNIPSIISQFTTSPVLCTGQNITLTDASSGGPTAWAWTMTGASPATSTVSSPVINYSTAGIYSITIAATNGTVSTCAATQTIQVLQTPVVTAISSPSAICVNNTATLTANGASSYLWNDNSTSSNLVLSPSTNVTYTVTGNTNGCANTATVALIVNPLPNVTASGSSSLICDGEAASLTAGGAVNYVWNTSATTSSIVVSPTLTTLYTVTGTDANGCSNTATVNLIVSWCTGLNEATNSSTDFSIFPNPNQGVLFIRSAACENCQVIVMNNIGQVINTINLSGNETKVDISREANGIYQLIIRKDGKAVYGAKVIKN